MNESKNFRVALLSGGLTHWRESITPLLLAQTDCLIVVETVDELLSMQQAARPEIIFICHQPENFNGIAVAKQIRALSAVTPLVLLATVNVDILKAAVEIGALAVLEQPFSGELFISAFNRCCHLAQTLRWEELKHLQNRSRSELFMQSPFCHLFVDADGMVTSINHEAATVMGLDANITSEFSEISRRFFAPHSLSYPSEMEMAVQSRTSWNGILAGQSPDKTSRVYRVICVPLAPTDIVSGMLITLHDITKVQADQAQLRIELQAARDCQLLAALSEANLELQQSCSLPSVTSLSLEVFSLSALLESIKNTGGASLIDLTIPDYLPMYFRGDAKRLGHALKAVTSGNAAFGKGSQHISLFIKERTPTKMTIQFNFMVENCVTSSDNYQGIGDYLATTIDIPHAATGLGLAAMLVAQMNGTLLIRNEQGRGRTVSFTVPLLPEADGVKPVSPVVAFTAGVSLELNDVPKPIASLKILVAEDNLMEQTTLKHLLEGIGCQVILVGNGKEAIDEFENGEFDVVLMDILMPVMDGFEATRLIRERERITGGSVPVVALTSYSLKAIQEKCVSVGMNGYLAKPVAKNKLVEALQRLSKPLELSAQAEVNMPNLDDFPVLEARAVIENLDYDLDTFRDLIEMYLTGFAGQGDELAEKLVGGDLKDILECAHTLKGIVSNIGG